MKYSLPGTSPTNVVLFFCFDLYIRNLHLLKHHTKFYIFLFSRCKYYVMSMITCLNPALVHPLEKLSCLGFANLPLKVFNEARSEKSEPPLASGNNPERMFPATLLSALPVIPCAAPLNTSKLIYKYSYTVYL